MSDKLSQVSSIDMEWVLGSSGVIIASVTGAVWALMNRQVTHWKDSYQAKVSELADSRKETEQVRTHPEMLAMKLIEQAETIVSAQIKRLKETVEALRAECVSKDVEIKNLTMAAKANEEQLVYAQEGKEKLEREIEVYDEIMQRLLSRRDRARESLSSFRSGDFNVDGLDGVIDEEIRKRMVHVNASSFSRWSKIQKEAARQASSKAEMRSSNELKAKMGAINATEVGDRVAVHAEVPAPRSEGRNSERKLR